MHLGPYFIIAIAGITSALCYVSVAVGPPAALFFAYIAPLPILIAGLGWGLMASSGAVLVAALICLLAANPGTGGLYLAAVGGPAVWLSHLAVLARPVSAPDGAAINDPNPIEWYPPGRLLIWAGILGGSTLALTLARMNFDLEAYRAPIEALLGAFFKHNQSRPGLPDDLRGELISGLAFALPLAAAMLWTATMLFNLWLAARIVSRSGQLPRPWPDLSATELPPTFLAAFFVIFAVAGLAGGAVGYVAAFYASALGVVWVLIGLAVLHSVTRGRSFRRPLLIFVYVILIVFGWPAVPLMVLGIVEQIVQLRRRFGRSTPSNNQSS